MNKTSRYLKIGVIVVLSFFLITELYDMIISKEEFEYNHREAIRLFITAMIIVFYTFDVLEKKKS
jgi:hypothetical protein